VLGDLVKEGNGKLVMNLKNNDYTGRTIINGGTLSIADILDAGQVCPIGTSSAVADNLQINGGRLEFTGTNSSTNHGIAIKDTARISIVKSNGSLALGGIISGKDAVLVKEGDGQLNLCQTTTNPVKSVVLAGGVIAQGDWRMSLGTVPFLVTGKDTKYNFVANGSMSSVPTIQNAITIEEGAKLTINGAERAGLKGSVSGSGTLVLNTGGVRYDISTDMSKLAGTLHINGGARLMSNVTDLKLATLSLGDGASVRHYKNGAGNGVAAALHVGALTDASGYSSFKTKPTFGGSDESWFVGYNNADATFSGKLLTKSVTKMGTGNWTIKGNENTSSITVKEGKLTIFNITGVATTGTMTVGKGAVLAGTGTTNSIVAQTGAVVKPGMTDDAVATLTTNSNAIMQAGATLVVNVSATSNSKLNVKGSIFSMAGNDTIVIAPQAGRTFIVGEKLTLFPGTKPASGWIIKSTDGSLWDDSTLAADGSIVCTQATTGISAVDVDEDEIVDVLTVDGKVVKNDVKRRNATNGLPHGIYVVGGKVVRK
jgi:autotransporter-associated beta strand protein